MLCLDVTFPEAVYSLKEFKEIIYLKKTVLVGYG